MFTCKASGREERPGALHRTRVGSIKARIGRERIHFKAIQSNCETLETIPLLRQNQLVGVVKAL